MKILKTLFLLLCLPIMLNAKEYYVATNGNDANAGSIDSPFATLHVHNRKQRPATSYIYAAEDTP